MSEDRNSWIGEPLRQINELQAYDAMLAFLEAYWLRGNGTSDDIAVLLGSLSRETGSGRPLDPAQWSDWRGAVSGLDKGP